MPETIRSTLEAILSACAAASTGDGSESPNEAWAHLMHLENAFLGRPPVRRRPNLKMRWSVKETGRLRVPCLVFLDERVTTRAQGVYCLYSFCQDMGGVCLAFCRGVAEPKNEGGMPEGRWPWRESPADLRKLCHPLESRGFRLDGAVNLQDDPRPIGSPVGNGSLAIAHKLYAAGEVPDDEALLDDLEAMLKVYDRCLAEAKWEEAIRLCALLLQGRSAVEVERGRKHRLELTRQVREAVDVSTDPVDAVSLLNGAFTNPLMKEQKITQYHRFLKWSAFNPEKSREAITALIEDTASLEERVNGFLALVPNDAVSGPGTRLSIASFLLMGIDPVRYPIYKFSPFETVERILGWAKPLEDESPGKTYVHHRAFAQWFLDELREHGLGVRDLFDAQGLIWNLTTSKDPAIVLWREQEPDPIVGLDMVLAWVGNLRPQQSPDGVSYHRTLLLLAILDVLDVDPNRQNRFGFGELLEAVTRLAEARGSVAEEGEFSQAYLRMGEEANPLRVWNLTSGSGLPEHSEAIEPSHAHAMAPYAVLHPEAWAVFRSPEGRSQLRRKVGEWLPSSEDEPAESAKIDTGQPDNPSGRRALGVGSPTTGGTRRKREDLQTGKDYYYTPEQATRMLGRRVDWIHRKMLPSVVVDGQVWYLAAAVEDLVERTYGARQAHGAPKPRKLYAENKEKRGKSARVLRNRTRTEGEAAEGPNYRRNAEAPRYAPGWLESASDATRPDAYPERARSPFDESGVGASEAPWNLPRASGHQGTRPAAPYDPKAAGERLAGYAHELLRLLSKSGPAREALSAIDESVDDDAFEAIMRCLNKRPRNLQDLLVLFALAEPARTALYMHQSSWEEAALDDLYLCLRTVERQIESGNLHRASLMDFVPVQDFNCGFRPPARDLQELLCRLQYLPSPVSLSMVELINTATASSSLEEDLALMLGRLGARGAEVIRRRYSVESRTLREVGERLGVTHERVRQIQMEAVKRLKEAYFRELPLLRLRSSMLLVNEHEAFSAWDMAELLRSHGLLESSEAEPIIADLIAVWRALEPDESAIAKRLIEWRAIRPDASSFPEEVISVAKTGLTTAQREVSETIMRTVRKRVFRYGAFRLQDMLAEVFGEAAPREADAEAALTQAGYARSSSGYWVGDPSGSSVPRRIAEKMLATCGPLDVHRICEGIVRHQGRHGHDVPSIGIVRAALERYDTLEVRDDGTVQLKNPDASRQALGAWERVWLSVVSEHGPVVHYHKILQAYARNGLSKVTAQVLVSHSCLVEKVDDLLYCRPGAVVGEQEVRQGRGQSFSGSKTRTPSSVVAPHGEPVPDIAAPASRPDRLRGEVTSGEPFEPEVSEVLRARLRLDVEAGRVLISVPETVWPGNARVRLHWDGRERAVASSYLAEEDTTFARAVELPTGKPNWGKDALMVTENSRRALRLPNPPRGRGAVFLPKGGRHTLHWRMGEEYYVVIPAATFSGSHADTLFEEWNRLGGPEGWDGHLILWVRTREPSREAAAPSRRSDGSAGTVQFFEDAARSLGLPTYDHLRRVRGRLIGGDRLPSAGGDAFAVDRPPQLEVSGLWEGPRTVTLSRAVRGADEFVVQDSVRLHPSARASVVVSLWEAGRSAPRGRYRVEVADERPIEFFLLKPSDSSLPFAFDVGFGLEGAEGGGVLRRSDLESGSLTVRAWPGARLSLEVANGAWSRRTSVTADEKGRWNSRWGDLGMGDVPAGPVDITASWRGLGAARATFVDGPHVAEGGVQLLPNTGGAEQSFHLSGKVTGAGRGLRVRAFLIGSRPWHGQVWSEKIEVGEQGRVEARFPSAGEARWLVMLPGDESEDEPEGQPDGTARPLLIQAQEKHLPARAYPLSRLSARAESETWGALRRELLGFPLPPDLRRLLDLSSLGSVLSGSLGNAPDEARWRTVEPGSLARLSSWTPFGLCLPVAIFASVQPGWGETPAGRSLDLLAVDAADLLAAMDGGGGETGLMFLKGGSRGRMVRGTLHAVAAAEGWRFELRPGEELYACPRCGMVLPPGEFQGHRPPGKRMRPCHAVRRSFTILGTGKALAVDLWAHLDPMMLLHAIIELVNRIDRDEGEDIPAQAELWLDRAHEAYSEEARGRTPSRWITDVGDLLERLYGLRERAEENEAALAELGRAVDANRAGLGVLSDLIGSEVGQADATAESGAREAT